mgnify:FL=1|tara:strand:+ start:182 stop:442 length:261 start_codon:yes stop_codon:yes gene_type:complete
MFTVEMEEDFSLITTLDDNAEFEDLQVLLDTDNRCYIRQWDEGRQRFTTIVCGFKQLFEVVQAMSSSSGAYTIEIDEGHSEGESNE